MFRNLYFLAIARKHIGEPVCTSCADGVLRAAGPLGFTVETPDRNDMHIYWNDIDYLRTGERLVLSLERARRRAEEVLSEDDEDDAPLPAFDAAEQDRMMAEWRA